MTDMREALEDCKTHREAWRSALLAQQTPFGSDDDGSYWAHELKVFDATFAALAAPSEPVRWLCKDEHRERIVKSSDEAEQYQKQHGWTVTPLYAYPRALGVEAAQRLVDDIRNRMGTAKIEGKAVLHVFDECATAAISNMGK